MRNLICKILKEESFDWIKDINPRPYDGIKFKAGDNGIITYNVYDSGGKRIDIKWVDRDGHKQTTYYSREEFKELLDKYYYIINEQEEDDFEWIRGIQPLTVIETLEYKLKESFPNIEMRIEERNDTQTLYVTKSIRFRDESEHHAGMIITALNNNQEDQGDVIPYRVGWFYETFSIDGVGHKTSEGGDASIEGRMRLSSIIHELSIFLNNDGSPFTDFYE